MPINSKFIVDHIPPYIKRLENITRGSKRHILNPIVVELNELLTKIKPTVAEDEKAALKVAWKSNPEKTISVDLTPLLQIINVTITKLDVLPCCFPFFKRTNVDEVALLTGLRDFLTSLGEYPDPKLSTAIAAPTATTSPATQSPRS